MNPHGLRDADMILLLALSVGNPIDVIDGEMRLPDSTDPAGASVPVPTGSLDRLEDAGCVAIEDVGPVLTDRGRYWLERWLKKTVRVRGGGRDEPSAPADARRSRFHPRPRPGGRMSDPRHPSGSSDPPAQPAAGVGPVNGFTVTVRDSLTGAKNAVRYGDRLYVSPAMWELLRSAEGPEELTFILNHIPVTVLPYTPPGYVRPIYSPAFAPPQLGTPS